MSLCRPWLSRMLYSWSLDLSTAHVELPTPAPAQVDREHDDPLPRAVQVFQPAGQPPAIAGEPRGQTHG